MRPLFYLSPAGFIYIYWYIFGAAAAWLFADWDCRGRGVRSEGGRSVPFVWCVRCEPSFARTPGKIFLPEGDKTTGFLRQESREIGVYAVGVTSEWNR